MDQPPEDFSFTTTTETVRSWAERNGFAHWVIALLWLIPAFILFQLVAGVAYIGLLLVSGRSLDAADLMGSMSDSINLLFIGNSIGQILIIGLATLLIVRLHIGSESKRSFLRFRWNNQTMTYLLMGGLLIIFIQPIIIYLGYLNSLLPIPDFFDQMQVSTYEMIEEFLTSDGIILFGLFNIALVPAVCEEVLFRGYFLRAFEKSWGPIAAVLVSGFIFGLYHIQLGNLFPLATLGIILALMTWLSGSIWPAVLAHFMNNGAAVVLGSQYPELVFQDMSAEHLPSIWVLLISSLLTGTVIYWMIQKSKQLN